MRTLLCACGLVLACFALVATRPQGPAPKLRIGTYDGRAIAVAYAASRFNPVAQKVAERDAAKKAGDERKVKELELWGERFQRQLHRQAFARVPVDDLLQGVQDGLAKVARERTLAAITERCTFTGAEVEVVDVTDALVLLFEPSAKTLENVAGVCKHAPIDLDEIERDEAH